MAITGLVLPVDNTERRWRGMKILKGLGWATLIFFIAFGLGGLPYFFGKIGAVILLAIIFLMLVIAFSV